MRHTINLFSWPSSALWLGWTAQGFLSKNSLTDGLLLYAAAAPCLCVRLAWWRESGDRGIGGAVEHPIPFPLLPAPLHPCPVAPWLLSSWDSPCYWTSMPAPFGQATTPPAAWPPFLLSMGLLLAGAAIPEFRISDFGFPLADR